MSQNPEITDVHTNHHFENPKRLAAIALGATVTTISLGIAYFVPSSEAITYPLAVAGAIPFAVGSYQGIKEIGNEIN